MLHIPPFQVGYLAVPHSHADERTRTPAPCHSNNHRMPWCTLFIQGLFTWIKCIFELLMVFTYIVLAHWESRNICYGFWLLIFVRILFIFQIPNQSGQQHLLSTSKHVYSTPSQHTVTFPMITTGPSWRSKTLHPFFDSKIWSRFFWLLDTSEVISLW